MQRAESLIHDLLIPHELVLEHGLQPVPRAELITKLGVYVGISHQLTVRLLSQVDKFLRFTNLRRSIGWPTLIDR